MTAPEKKAPTIAGIVDACIDDVLDKCVVTGLPAGAYEAGNFEVVLRDAERARIHAEVKKKILEYLGF